MIRPPDESLAKILEEEEFLSLFTRAIGKLFEIHNFLLANPDTAPRTKRFYSCLVEEARELKNFLDDHEARSNRRFAFFTEAVLSIVTFGAVAYLVKHLLMRYPRYHLHDGHEKFVDYHTRAEGLLEFCHATILGLLGAARGEAKSLGAELPRDRVDESSFTDDPPRRHLPHNVDERDSPAAEGEVPILATMFLQFADRFTSIGEPEEGGAGAIKEFLDLHCNDARVRQWEADICVIQRKYDTLVKNTSWDSRDEDLGALRGHVSMVLHHAEMLRYLGQFLEHLEGGIRYEPAAARIARVVDRDEMIRRTYGFVFGEALRYIRQGRGIAEGLLSRYTKVLEYSLQVPEDTILHARPAALIVAVVNHYGTPVSATIGGTICDASSIMQLMMTVGNHPDERTLLFRGDEKPLGDLKLLFENNLGEDGLEQLPRSLRYLRPGAPPSFLPGG